MTKIKAALSALRGRTRYWCPCGMEVTPTPVGNFDYWYHSSRGRPPSAPNRQVVDQSPRSPGNLHTWLDNTPGLCHQSLIVFEEYADDDEE